MHVFPATEKEWTDADAENERALQEYEDSDPELSKAREEFYDSYTSAVQACIDRRR